MRKPRKLKKKLRCIALCYSGNPNFKKLKLSYSDWCIIGEDMGVWLSNVNMEDRRNSNLV